MTFQTQFNNEEIACNLRMRGFVVLPYNTTECRQFTRYFELNNHANDSLKSECKVWKNIKLQKIINAFLRADQKKCSPFCVGDSFNILNLEPLLYIQYLKYKGCKICTISWPPAVPELPCISDMMEISWLLRHRISAACIVHKYSPSEL